MTKCSRCSKEKPETNFQPLGRRRADGRPIRRNICKACKHDLYGTPNSGGDDKIAARSKNKIVVARYMIREYRKQDKKHGRANDLTAEFVVDLLAKSCAYCGDSTSRIVLDRIDNTKGHCMSNVVQACPRCNHIKSNMPHAAWLAIVPAIKQAFIAGLFGDWSGPVTSVRVASKDLL